jgi:hypothetical protein
VTRAWTADAAVSDLVAVDEVLGGLADAGPEERLRATAAHFERRYGAAEGRRVLGAFVRLCLYLEQHGAELRRRGLVDEAGRTVDRAFLEALLVRLAEASDASDVSDAAGAAGAAGSGRAAPDGAERP